MLDKAGLEDALLGISSIPATRSLDGRMNPLIAISGYDDWPYKIVYSSKGLSGETILGHINAFYDLHRDIPITRRPNLIHVLGSYAVIRAVPGMRRINVTSGVDDVPEEGTFVLVTRDPDLHAIVWALKALQQNAYLSTEISFSIGDLMLKLLVK